jgi:preprotein translocase subunit SecA
MRPAVLAHPGIATGPYPERAEGSRSGKTPSWSLPRAPARVEQRRNGAFLQRVHAHDDSLRGLSDNAFQARLRELRARLAASSFAEAPTAEAFALVREAARRELGQAHYDTQLIAGKIMLGNQLAEMATGEGKTLTAALAAATAALAGMPVHLVTANDYLVTRDAQLLGPVYRKLGLSVGTVTRPMDQAQRRLGYGCDITYCTAKELVFDYLRDRLVRRAASSDLHERVRQMDVETGAAAQPRLLLRGLWVALIDEADSILIDEARTPLVLSQSRVNPQQQRYVRDAFAIADRLRLGIDFRIDASAGAAELTEAGRAALAAQAGALGGLWQDRRHRDEIVTLALAARHVFLRDRHYLVHDGKIVMIDQTTGRLAPGRVWSRGLHQLIEEKEGCAPTGETETIAQITYQRFFPRYLRLGGMSGTLAEAAVELRSVYGLRIARVPLRKPSQRVYMPTRVFASRDEKWQAVVERIGELSRAGRPVLIGTDSVADSDELGRRLSAQGAKHVVLNARHDAEEAAIVARAGEVGSVVVTTNMAGRGTDIVLASGVRERGGLHVICCQHNASGRIDRQLQGRCARQGDPGSVETILSLEDTLISRYWPAWLRAALSPRPGSGRPLATRIGRLLAYLPQQLEERRQRNERKALLANDKQADRRLSFAGRGE